MSLERAITDMKRFSQGEWSTELIFTAPNAETATVQGFGSKHHLSIDPETGIPVNSSNIHVSVAESVILDENAAYPTRDSNDEIYLKDHLVSFADSSGTVKQYKINENFPNETLDLIVCILGEYAN